MGERVLRGSPASPGVAAGRAVLLSPSPSAPAVQVDEPDRPAEAARAQVALDAARAQLERLAADLVARGREEDAEIVATGALMAADPVLRARVIELVAREGRPAAGAILTATSEQADHIAAIPDETLAARADDVRSLGRRAAALTTPTRTPAPEGSGTQGSGTQGSGTEVPGTQGSDPVVPGTQGSDPVVPGTQGSDPVVPGTEGSGTWGADGPQVEGEGLGSVLVAVELGPADVVELGPEVRGILLGGGSPTAHAAIVARSLGIPMVVGLGEEVLSFEAGSMVVVDGDAGVACGDPTPERVAEATAAARGRAAGRARAIAERREPAVTRDGRRVRVLANVVSTAEVEAALELGAEGAGLIRTELHFLDASGWPDEAAHRRALAPVLTALQGRPATVRVLDYGGDKTPPFLHGTRERGLSLLLHAPDALEAQLRAALDAGRETELRILLPMVADPRELAEAAAALGRAVEATGARRPLLGAMIETPAAARAAAQLAAAADFLSIGTNDLTHATLGTDRFEGADAPAHDPRVLAHIAACAEAAHANGRFLEVCGEAASNPLTLPLLVGLGVDELSVGAARVGTTRAWVRSLREHDARALADQALGATDAAAVERLAAPTAAGLRSVERGEAAAQGVNGSGGVAALRT
jgi:phosphoenolpyruvate-protein kinase (PTS system EI component)